MPTLRTGDCGGFDHKDTILEADRIAFAIVAGGTLTANGARERFVFLIVTRWAHEPSGLPTPAIIP
jgi:hypothetical protein